MPRFVPVLIPLISVPLGFPLDDPFNTDISNQANLQHLNSDARPVPVFWPQSMDAFAWPDEEDGFIDSEGETGLHARGCDCGSRMEIDDVDYILGCNEDRGSSASREHESSSQANEDEHERSTAIKSASMRGWSDHRLEKEITALRARDAWITHHVELANKSSSGESSTAAMAGVPLPLDEAVKQAKAKVERLQLAAKQQQVRVDLQTVIVFKLTKEKERLKVTPLPRKNHTTLIAGGPFAVNLVATTSALA